jgi:hypothetical protein
MDLASAKLLLNIRRVIPADENVDALYEYLIGEGK